MPELSYVKGVIYGVNNRVRNAGARLYAMRPAAGDFQGYLAVAMPEAVDGQILKNWRVNERGNDPVIDVSIAVARPYVLDDFMKVAIIGYTKDITKYPLLTIYSVNSMIPTVENFYDLLEIEAERTGEYVEIPSEVNVPYRFPLRFPILLT